MTTFEVFLKELAKVLQFQTLTPDSSGACMILMKDENISLLFEYDDHLVPNTILLSSEIASIPVDKRTEFYETSLEENIEFEETVSVKPDEDLLFMHIRIHPEIEAQELDQVLNKFLEHAKKSKEKAEQLIKQQSSPPFPPSIKTFKV